MKKSPLNGKRYINLLRCSTAKQGDTSIPDQKTVNDAFAKEHGMVWVRDVELAGVSASKTFNRIDIDALVEDARVAKNFDVVLVHDLSRLTRGGIRHAAHVRRQFEKVKVRVVSANDNIPEGEEAEFFEAFINWKNKTYAKNLAQQAARGSRSSLEAGRRPHCSHTPFGFDRLYSGPDDKPRCILRQIDGGMRHLIDCDTGKVREITIDANGRFAPFQKQHDETSKLVIGADEAVAAVRLMFEMRYKFKHSYNEITAELHRRQVKPPFADYWCVTAIRKILHNPIYLGRAIACRFALGVHVVLGPERPQPTPVNQAEYEDTGRSTIDAVHRPREEWYEREEKHLQEILIDPLVRERAKIAIDEALEKFCLPKQENYLKRKGAMRERHRKSPYILKDAMLCRDGDLLYRMRGCMQGNGHLQRRTYGVSEYFRRNPKAMHLSHYAPALQAEGVVLTILRSVFANQLYVKKMIELAVSQEMAKHASKLTDEKKLVAEDQALARKIRRLIDSSEGSETDRATERQLSVWKQRRQEIKGELNAVRVRTEKVDAAAVIAHVEKTLFVPDDELDGESYFRLRNVVNTWCANMEIDLPTRELTFEVKVPDMQSLQALARGGEMCLQGTFTRQGALDAQSKNRPVIGKFRCWSPHGGVPIRQWSHGWEYRWEQINKCTNGADGKEDDLPNAA